MLNDFLNVIVFSSAKLKKKIVFRPRIAVVFKLIQAWANSVMWPFYKNL